MKIKIFDRAGVVTLRRSPTIQKTTPSYKARTVIKPSLVREGGPLAVDE